MRFARFCLFFGLAAAPFGLAAAQSIATASRGVVPSAFAGLTGDYTGVGGGRNLSFTAGVDLGFKPFLGLLPSLEVRATYPMDSGQVVGQEDVLAGIRVQKRLGRLRPYADFLYGRGEMNYQNGGLIVPMQAFRYLQTTGNVISPGVGLETDLTQHFALLLDGQLQFWGVPYDPSGKTGNPGHVTAFPGTIGVVYRFGWLQHGHPAP